MSDKIPSEIKEKIKEKADVDSISFSDMRRLIEFGEYGYSLASKQPSPPSADYWKKRCEAAEEVIERFVGESIICSPHTEKGKEIYNEWQQLKNNPTDEEGEDEIKDIDFIVWFSGMDEHKVKAAYERYKIEIEQGQP